MIELHGRVAPTRFFMFLFLVLQLFASLPFAAVKYIRDCQKQVSEHGKHMRFGQFRLECGRCGKKKRKAFVGLALEIPRELRLKCGSSLSLLRTPTAITVDSCSAV